MSDNSRRGAGTPARQSSMSSRSLIFFIDASHFADDVMLDAVMAWRLLRKDGVLVFDDYLWWIEQYGWKKNPANAINLFPELVEGDFTLLHVGHQLAIRKSVSASRYS